MHSIYFNAVLLPFGAVQHNVIHQIAEIVVLFFRLFAGGGRLFREVFQGVGGRLDGEALFGGVRAAGAAKTRVFN